MGTTTILIFPVKIIMRADWKSCLEWASSLEEQYKNHQLQSWTPLRPPLISRER